MPDLPSFGTLFRIARDEILSRNPRLSRDSVERSGMDTNILIAGGCAAADEVIGQLTTLSAGLYLSSASGAALDRLVFDRYGMTRKPAAVSIGSVQFSSTAPSSQAFALPEGTTLQSVDGVQFVTSEASIYPINSTGPVTVAIRSVLAGAEQTAKAETITTVVSAIQSAPGDLKVTNPYATAGADDAETDADLRERARRFFPSARKGTLAALEAAALGVSGVRKASAFEVVDSLGRPARMVQLVISDAFTEQFAKLDSIPARYQTQSQNLATLVYESLYDVRPAGVYVQVIVASVVLQAIQLALTFTAGADVNASALQARAMAVGYVNGLPPGASFVASDLLAQLKLVPGISYTGGELVSPSGNVAAKPIQALRTSLGIVAAVAAQTSTPIITGSNPDAYSLTT